MANTCFTNWALEGPKEDITKIHTALDVLVKRENSLPYNRRSPYCQLYMLLKGLGVDAPDKGVDYRSEFNLDIEYYPDYSPALLKFTTEDAWAPKTEAMMLLKKTFPKVKFYYICEETGCGVMLTNDKNSKYFGDRFLVEACIPVEHTVTEYFCTEQEVIDWVNGEFNEHLAEEGRPAVHVNTLQDVKDLESSFGELEQETGEDAYFCLHAFRVAEEDFNLLEDAA